MKLIKEQYYLTNEKKLRICYSPRRNFSLNVYFCVFKMSYFAIFKKINLCKDLVYLYEFVCRQYFYQSIEESAFFSQCFFIYCCQAII